MTIRGAFSHCLVAVGLMSLLSSTAELRSQQIDPSVLSKIQGQLGVPSGSDGQTSPVDAARQAGSDRVSTGGGELIPAETPSERALRELQARRQLESVRPSLPIERDFQQRLGDKTLRLFGYELFEPGERQRASAPLTGQVGDNYVLGVGDEIVVQLRGSTNRSMTTRVDREGRLIIDQMPPVSAAGRSLGAVRGEIERMTRATLLGTDAYVSLGSVRSISVLVSGEVNQPGLQSMTSLNDVVTAIMQAGGIRRGGSLRSIRVNRGGQTILVDLYGLLGLAPAPRVRLQDGDRVVVPPLGRTIAVAGGVARKGIFEVPAGQTGLSVKNAVDLAGGALRPRGNIYAISRINASGIEQVSEASGLGDGIQAGDAIVVTPRERGMVGLVRLSGFVDTPGFRALDAAPGVRALLGGSQRSLRDGTYLPFAALMRVDPATNARQMVAVNLMSVFNGRDVTLRSGDELVVLDADSIAFLQSNTVRNVVLGDPDDVVGCRSLQSLQSMVAASQSDRFVDLLRGAFLVDRNGKTGVSSAGRALSQGRTGVDNPDAVQDSADSASELLRLRSRSQGSGAAEASDAMQADMAAGEQTDCPAVFEKNPALLPFVLENLAVVSGSVRNPGPYPVAEQLSLQSLISVAGGYTSNADKSAVEIVDLLGNRQSAARRVIESSQTPDAMRATLISAGDDVHVRGLIPVYEPGGVLLSGEVVRPGLYSIRKGETLADLLERAGGLTDQAYAYGAVFTRRSVKQAQAEGYKRTARELNSALLSVTARRNVDAEGIAAAAELAKTFSEIDAVGRLVVEADPRVLEQRRDLNTTLEAGDAIFFPKRPNFVIAVGDVLNPGALQFTPGKTITDYIGESGGTQRSADKKRIFLVYPNGSARPISMGTWTRSNLVVPPGSTIVVPKNIDPLRKFEMIRDVSAIISQLAVSLASVAVLSSNN